MNKKTIIIVAFVALIIIFTCLATLGWYYKTNKISTSLSKLNNNYCDQNSDCIKWGNTDKRFPCCPSEFIGSRAINQNTLTEIQAWMKQNCSSQEYAFCPMYRTVMIGPPTKAACVKNKCEIVEIKTIDECEDGDTFCINKFTPIE